MTKLLFRPVTWVAHKNKDWPEHGNGWFYDKWLSENEKSVQELRNLISRWQSGQFTTQYALEHPDGTLELFLEKPA